MFVAPAARGDALSKAREFADPYGSITRSMTLYAEIDDDADVAAASESLARQQRIREPLSAAQFLPRLVRSSDDPIYHASHPLPYHPGASQPAPLRKFLDDRPPLPPPQVVLPALKPLTRADDTLGFEGRLPAKGDGRVKRGACGACCGQRCFVFVVMLLFLLICACLVFAMVFVFGKM